MARASYRRFASRSRPIAVVPGHSVGDPRHLPSRTARKIGHADAAYSQRPRGPGSARRSRHGDLELLSARPRRPAARALIALQAAAAVGRAESEAGARIGRGSLSRAPGPTVIVWARHEEVEPLSRRSCTSAFDECEVLAVELATSGVQKLPSARHARRRLLPVLRRPASSQRLPMPRHEPERVRLSVESRQAAQAGCCSPTAPIVARPLRSTLPLYGHVIDARQAAGGNRHDPGSRRCLQLQSSASWLVDAFAAVSARPGGTAGRVQHDRHLGRGHHGHAGHACARSSRAK